MCVVESTYIYMCGLIIIVRKQRLALGLVGICLVRIVARLTVRRRVDLRQSHVYSLTHTRKGSRDRMRTRPLVIIAISTS